MIHIATLLDPTRLLCQQNLSSKKRALEQLSQLFEHKIEEFDAHRLFDALMSRERLGSTGLGEGIGLPHARVAGLAAPCAAIITLNEGIDYDTPDNKPVDILFCLLIPENSENEHLKILSVLAKGFHCADNREQIRQATSSDALLEIFNTWASDD